MLVFGKFCVRTKSINPIDGPMKLEPVATNAVFANNELSFKYINTYGFDYDYTLASYSNELHLIIYQMALDNLVQKYGVSNLSSAESTEETVTKFHFY